MNHLDLFSGIGGFTLAAGWAGFETVGFSEIKQYACSVLDQTWPHIKNYGDIRQIKGSELPAIKLITGGFPCQPYSVAGKQRGKKDDRNLWPEMFRVIQECKPAWVLGENVIGIIEMELDNVLDDLENEGYTAQAFDIPSIALGADHGRERIWIAAYLDCDGQNKGAGPNFYEEAHGQRSTGQNQIRQDGGGRSLRASLERNCSTRRSGGARAPLLRVDDELPNRSHRIEALGNSIEPEIAYEIVRLMK